MNYNALIPELTITNFEKTKFFYTQLLGFSVVYERMEENFAFLKLGNAQLMIDQIDKGRTWRTGKFFYPLGRGVNFQIEVDKIDPIMEKLHTHHIDLFLLPEEQWYQTNNQQVGNKQFGVQDPDGYLLRFFESLGTKPAQGIEQK